MIKRKQPQQLVHHKLQQTSCLHHHLIQRWIMMIVMSIFAITLSACQSVPNTSPSTSSQTNKPTPTVINPSTTGQAGHRGEYESNEAINRPTNSSDDHVYNNPNTMPNSTVEAGILTGDDHHSTQPDSSINSSHPVTQNPQTQPSVNTDTSSTSDTNDNSQQGSTTQTDRQNTATQPVTEPDPKLTQQILLQRARMNSRAPTTTSEPTLDDGANVPAFQRLMDTGIAQLANGQYSAADSTFTRAQRLAPQSSAVYFYLGQVALKRNQPHRAEAMARRGLGVAQTTSRRRGLWQVILLSGQMQNNQRVVNEAQTALGQL